jgi:hypothetical protein|mmetsp:Transcript_82474/g.137612  ORF Transcript_82474/g.137612 Transcript_82474/m.137612 type:complete len:162 (+) Transcript_82474:1231-1716(+)
MPQIAALQATSTVENIATCHRFWDQMADKLENFSGPGHSFREDIHISFETMFWDSKDNMALFSPCKQDDADGLTFQICYISAFWYPINIPCAVRRGPCALPYTYPIMQNDLASTHEYTNDFPVHFPVCIPAKYCLACLCISSLAAAHQAPVQQFGYVFPRV